MAVETIKVPDLGGASAVEVIEIAISPGDEIGVEDTLLVLESDKATMDVPSPVAGVVKKVLVKLGDSVSQGTAIVDVEVAASATGRTQVIDTSEAAPPAVEFQGAVQAKPPAPVPASGIPPGAGHTPRTVALPDLGTADAVDIIDIAISAGDVVEEGQTLMTLEGDKATMDVPSPYAGKVVKLLVAQGDKVKSGAEVAVIESADAVPGKDTQVPPSAAEGKEEFLPAPVAPVAASPVVAAESPGGKLNEAEAPLSKVYAGPVVRQFARELGVDLRNVKGSGVKGRVQKEDVQGYVKLALENLEKGPGSVSGGMGIPPVPDMDFSQFGDVEDVVLDRIARLTATNMSRNWLNVPAVTQFDDADITDLEAFRKSLKGEAEKRGVKLTPVAFIMLACARLLREHPVFNRSWHSSGEKVIQKHYVHIGMAVDTPRGLLVPVIRDADKKGLFELAADIAQVAEKARNGKLSATDMQGGSFSISSLGAIGGRGFTPIVNAPEAAILGVSRASVQPVWDGKQFAPREMLPLSLTYDHRIINGGDGGRFMTELVSMLGDIRRLLL